MSLEYLVKTLLGKGVKAEVKELKEHYKPSKRHTPYLISEITGKLGRYSGQIFFLSGGGVLIIEHKLNTNSYNAQFRLITSNPEELGAQKHTTSILQDLKGDKKHYGYTTSFIGYKSCDRLVEDILSNTIFFKRASCPDHPH